MNGNFEESIFMLDQIVLTSQENVVDPLPAPVMRAAEDPQEATMMDHLRSGKAEAMIPFFDLFYSRLCYFAERLIRNRPAAEDIVEDSFLKLWKKHADFGSIQNIKAFLYITTRNACLNFLKQTQRDEASKKELAYLSVEMEDFVLNNMIRSEVLQEIHREIEKLPTQSRKVFKMSVLENMKNQEIAIALDISVHTVKNQKMRAMQLLRMSLLNLKTGK